MTKANVQKNNDFKKKKKFEIGWILTVCNNHRGKNIRDRSLCAPQLWLGGSGGGCPHSPKWWESSWGARDPRALRVPEHRQYSVPGVPGRNWKSFCLELEEEGEWTSEQLWEAKGSKTKWYFCKEYDRETIREIVDLHQVVSWDNGNDHIFR